MVSEPKDADVRRAVRPVICYPNDTLPQPDMALYQAARQGARLVEEVMVPPREAAVIEVPAGCFLRMSALDGPQVGDLNLFAKGDLAERFYAGKTRALHGTHVTTGDRLWSHFPYLRPMATVCEDTLAWYGIDGFGGSVQMMKLCFAPIPPWPSGGGYWANLRVRARQRRFCTRFLVAATR